MRTFQKENYPLFLLIPILVCYLWSLDNNWLFSSDSAVYISLGRSLISGHGYTYMGYTHVRYPFLFPVILAPVIGLFGKNYLLMRLMVIVLGVASLGLVFLLFKQILGYRWGLLLMLLTGVSEYHYFYSHNILSDIPYTFFSLFALWYFVKNPELSDRKSIFVLAGLILMAYFTRTIGLILLPAVFFFQLFKDRNKISRTILLALIFLIPAGFWSYRNRMVPVKDQLPANRGESIHYFDEFFSRDLADKGKQYIGLGDIKDRLIKNIRYYREMTTILVLTRRFLSLQWTRLIPLLLAVGFVGCWFKQRTVIEYYLFLYVLAYLLWPALQGVRFYVPIFPILLYYLFFGIGIIVDSTGKLLKLPLKLKEKVRVGIIVLVVIFFAGAHAKAVWGVTNYMKRKGHHFKPVNNFLSSIQWAARNTRPEDILISDRAPWVYLLSERRTYSFARVPDSTEVLKSILERKPNYMITGRVTIYGRALDQVLAKNTHLFTEVYRKEDSAVYRIIITAAED